jgi:hypothetical protein
MHYRKTMAVSRLLNVSYASLMRLIYHHGLAVGRDDSNQYIWSEENIETAKKMLADRAALRRTEEQSSADR